MNPRFYMADTALAEAMEDALFRRQFHRASNLDSIAQQFRTIRKQNKMTQAALAQAIGTTQSAIARFETAHRGISLDLAMRISTALGKQLVLS